MQPGAATNIFFELHHDLPREGPGDDASTRRAYTQLKNVPFDARVLDIGAGPGMQTLQLARLTHGQVYALDTYPLFLAALQRSTRAARLEQRITLLRMSMFVLGFTPASFDVIWCEGAIYIHGFEAGLGAFQKLLKPGGGVAATEITWLKSNPPAELASFWNADYPGMGTLGENIQAAQRQGYQVVDTFTLSDSSWFESYYNPLQENIHKLREKYAGNADAQRQLDENQLEIDLFQRYSNWYGYVLYILQKI